MNDIVWLSVDGETPARGYWDMSLLEELFKNCNHHDKIGELKEAIVIIPGPCNGAHIDEVNKELSKLSRCKAIITSDEENRFPIDKLNHPNMQVYAMYYNSKFISNIKWIAMGPSLIEDREYQEKEFDFCFIGQVNHSTREKLVSILVDMPNGKVITSNGFAQGIPKDEYLDIMSKSKVAPSPMGNISPESFRMFEALEVGTTPITENKDYWTHIFEDMHVPVVNNWNGVENKIERYKNDNQYRNEMLAWWIRYKMDLKKELLELDESNEITVIIPTSAIKSNPSTDIIDKTIDSVRYHLPESKIIITFDGIREEQSSLRDNYDTFISKVLVKYSNKNVYPIVFSHHAHQVEMAKKALQVVDSQYILYVEHDTPLVKTPINFDRGVSILNNGKLDLVRFHFETVIPREHRHMILDNPIKYDGATFIRTCQWSQRPHLTTRAFYNRILSTCFTEDAKCFIEDKMHGTCHNSFVEDGELGWNNYKLAIYADEKNNIHFSYHTDGRQSENKYDESQVF